ncbi:hypothetical protein ABEP17_06260 [Priestia flexa]|jgi:uncharacterized membrane protein|uniref:Uncharacterized protein n=2 Tax=Priestia TaxID=2800373 RepID=A0A0V8JI08_9BACI|nr:MULTISPECIES: hypothetical protein [Bacillaceae]KSU86692.1 hypothetical protein AS180_17295 [Priestia veravalensis]KZB91950.1 hypothetical protein A2U94_08560 [Bacillus sp. VT 712]MBN8433285.1 hypothetical protein [Priestia flexa]MBY6086545.1 hypothetical protein [Priestia flexa]MCA0965811.1 hypothetical protein [Priestia flexa]
MKFSKVLYGMVHLVTPLTFFLIAVIWGHFGLSKPIWVNLSDNLSIIGIYYVGVSILWILNIKSIHKVSEEIENKKG